MTEVARAFTIGGGKHGDDDYLRKPKPVSHHVAALLRHLYAYLRGEERDPDGQLHLASVAARAMMILEMKAKAAYRSDARPTITASLRDVPHRVGNLWWFRCAYCRPHSKRNA
jgi:hypothetical protein